MWRVDGKVKEINRPSTSTKKKLKFDYDAMGNRIAKHVYDNQTGLLERSTYYILDAQGNQLTTYEHVVDNSTANFVLKERHIFGSSRLGMLNEDVNVLTAQIGQNVQHEVGKKYYELSNHLGNVLSVFTDLKIPQSSNTVTVSSYRVYIAGTTDYSPFGVELDGRTQSPEAYRYSFNGMEKDNELKGEGNSYDYGARMLDPRLGRWLTMDPLASKYPNITPYNFVGNNPILFVDYDGNDFGLKIDHDNQTIIIVANVYTTSKKAYREALSAAMAWNTQSANIQGYKVSFEISVQKPVKLSTDDVIQFYKDNGWGGLYKDDGKKIDKKKIREHKNKIAEMQTLDKVLADPIGNLYASNHGMNSKTIQDPSGETTAGVTENGYAISMHTFLYNNSDGTVRVEDQAKNMSERKHEFGHLFGLDDIGGTYFANDGIMVYKDKMNEISTKDIELIIQYAKDRLSGKIPTIKQESNVTKIDEKGTSNVNSPIK